MTPAEITQRFLAAFWDAATETAVTLSGQEAADRSGLGVNRAGKEAQRQQAAAMFKIDKSKAKTTYIPQPKAEGLIRAAYTSHDHATATDKAFLWAFHRKGRNEFVPLTHKEIATAMRREPKEMAQIIGGLLSAGHITTTAKNSISAIYDVTPKGQAHARTLKGAPKPKPIKAPPPKVEAPPPAIRTQADYAAALAKAAKIENAAAYKAGTIQTYNSQKPTGTRLTQLQARVLAAIENAGSEFTATSIAAAIESNRPQVAVAIKELQNNGKLSIYRKTRGKYAVQASPEGQESTKSEISDPPQPKTKVRVVEAYLTTNHSAAENAHVNRISLPAETWAAE